MSKNNNDNNKRDRISDLPDFILHDILSSLNTKHVVQTCLLSKRWKTVWTQIPTLNFDFNSYPFEIVESSSNGNTFWKQRSFKNFVLSVLAQHSGKHVQCLRYNSSKSRDERFLTELLKCYARCHRVPKLCIKTHHYYYFYDLFDWKSFFSEYNSLTELKSSCPFVNGREVLNLKSLRTFDIVDDSESESERQVELYFEVARDDIFEIPAWFYVD